MDTIDDITECFDAKILAVDTVETSLRLKSYTLLPDELLPTQKVTQLHIIPYKNVHALLLDTVYLGFFPR